MGIIKYPILKNIQPQQFAGLASDNYFARNLKALVLGNELINPLLPNTGGNNSPAKVVSSAGVGWDGTGSKYLYNQSLTTASVTNGNIVGTLFVLFVPTSTAINQTWASLVNGYASAQEKYTEFGLGTNASGQYSLVSRGGLGRVYVGNVGTPTIGLPTFFACSQTNNASRLFCLNGIISSNTTSTSGSGTMYADSLSVGSIYRPQLGSVSFTSAGPVLLAGWINKALTELELRELSANPWQIIEPKHRSFFFSSISSTSVTGSGTIASCDLSAPNTSVTTSATVGISLPIIDLSAPNATAITVSTSIASGSIAVTTLTAPSSSAITNASASGNIDSIDLSAPNATATTVGTVIASGTIDSVDLLAPNASVVGASSVVGVGSLQPIDLSAPNISAVAVVMGSGNFTGITLTAPSIQGVAVVAAVGGISSISLTAPTITQAPTITMPEIVNFMFDINTEFSLPFNIETEFNLAQNLNKEHTFEPFKIVEMSR
jgi:hypothetical protein